MRMRLERFKEEELDKMASWWKNKLTPQSMFGFKDFRNNPVEEELIAEIDPTAAATCSYTKQNIEENFKILQIRCHPDRYSGDKYKKYQEKAKKVFQLLEDAKEYLLFTTDGVNPPINNAFYKYYYLQDAPDDTDQGKFENIIKLICNMKKISKDSSSQISALQELISENSSLIHHTPDPRHLSYDLTYKNIFYFAVQWNEPRLLDWLLTKFPEKKNVLTKTAFDMSPLDFAMLNGHINILEILQKHYGVDWVTTQLDTYINSVDINSQCKLLKFCKKFSSDYFSKIKSDPLLLPALIKIGEIEDPDSKKLKRAIIGCPALYKNLDINMRKDHYMIVAFLAQQTNTEWLDFLPLSELDPKFAIALADRWPVLKTKVQKTLHRDNPPYINHSDYAEFQKACLALLFGIAVACVTCYFFPLIMLWPNELATLFMILPTTIVPLCLILGPMFIYSYLRDIYPEARKVNSILQQNGFFKNLPPDEATSQSQKAQENSSPRGNSNP